VLGKAIDILRSATNDTIRIVKRRDLQKRFDIARCGNHIVTYKKQLAPFRQSEPNGASVGIKATLIETNDLYFRVRDAAKTAKKFDYSVLGVRMVVNQNELDKFRSTEILKGTCKAGKRVRRKGRSVSNGKNHREHIGVRTIEMSRAPNRRNQYTANEALLCLSFESDAQQNKFVKTIDGLFRRPSYAAKQQDSKKWVIKG